MPKPAGEWEGQWGRPLFQIVNDQHGKEASCSLLSHPLWKVEIIYLDHTFTQKIKWANVNLACLVNRGWHDQYLYKSHILRQHCIHQWLSISLPMAALYEQGVVSNDQRGLLVAIIMKKALTATPFPQGLEQLSTKPTQHSSNYTLWPNKEMFNLDWFPAMITKIWTWHY